MEPIEADNDMDEEQVGAHHPEVQIGNPDVEPMDQEPGNDNDNMIVPVD